MWMTLSQLSFAPSAPTTARPKRELNFRLHLRPPSSSLKCGNRLEPEPTCGIGTRTSAKYPGL